MDSVLSTDAVKRATSPTCAPVPSITATPSRRSSSASLSSALSDESPLHEVACEEGSRGQPAKREYTVCSMCNTILEEGVSMELHVEEEHQGADRIFSMTVYPADIGMPTNGTLEQLGTFVLKEALTADKGPEVFRALQNAVAQLGVMLKKVREDTLSIFLFGSRVSLGVWDGEGDADLSAVSLPLAERGKWCDSSTTEKGMIKKIAAELRRCGFFYDELEVVLAARVPVVKRVREVKQPYELPLVKYPFRVEVSFPRGPTEKEDVIHEIEVVRHLRGNVLPVRWNRSNNFVVCEFDEGISALRYFLEKCPNTYRKRWAPKRRLPEAFYINIDISTRTIGIRNSWFLRAYYAQNHVFRVGYIFIKEWSQKCGVNNSRKGYLTSYAMSILWVYYLLSKRMAAFVDPTSISELPTEEQLEVPYMPLWPEGDPFGDLAHAQNVGRLVNGFFVFYATFDWDNVVVTLVSNPAEGTTTKEDLGWVAASEPLSKVLRKNIYYGIGIEDPYEEDLNLGRHLTPTKAAWVKAQFVRAAQLCTDSSDIFELLQDPVRRAEEDLRRALFQYLINCGGCATVRDACASLNVSHKIPLTVFAEHHRLSELWFDRQLRLRDAENNYRYRRRMTDMKKSEPFSKDTWEVMCDDVFVEPKDGHRVVFLANPNINYIQEPGSAPLEMEAARVALQPHLEAVSVQVEMMTSTLKAYANMGVQVQKDSLAKNCFYCYDGCLVFATARDRDHFSAFLRRLLATLAHHKSELPLFERNSDWVHFVSRRLAGWMHATSSEEALIENVVHCRDLIMLSCIEEVVGTKPLRGKEVVPMSEESKIRVCRKWAPTRKPEKKVNAKKDAP